MESDKIICAKWIGRFGNKCHSYLYGKHIEDRFGLKFYISSPWEGSSIFKNPAPLVSSEFATRKFLYGGGSKGTPQYEKNIIRLQEYNSSCGDNISLLDPCDITTYGNRNYAYTSLVTDADWFFRKLKLSDIKKYFEFNDELKNTDMYRYFEDAQGTYDAAHFRRTDISRKNYVGGHSMVSKKSYYDAFSKYDVNPSDVVWVSDEPNFGHSYDKKIPVIKGQRISWLPDFLKLMFARNLFRSNSSFSVWAAWLGNSNVYSPWLHEYSPGKEIDFDFVLGNHPHWMAVKGVHSCYQFNIKDDLKDNKMDNVEIKERVVNPMQKEKDKLIMVHWNGRFGNRVFSYIFGKSYADKFGLDFYLPSTWEGTRLFSNPDDKVIEDDELRKCVNQTHPDFDNLNFRARAVGEYNMRTKSNITYINPDKDTDYGKTNVFFDSLCIHSSRIFESYSKKKILNWLEFSDEVKTLDIYKRMEDKQGTYDIAHLRRDDISNANYNKNNPQAYSVVSKESYMSAFEKFGYDASKVEWTTDDWLGKWGVGKPTTVGKFKYPKWTYPVGSAYMDEIMFDWLPDFLRLYFARTIFRANSSFSWVAGFLSPCAKVYSPVLHERKIYRDASDEVEFEFVEGNHPHWMNLKGSACDEIIIKN